MKIISYSLWGNLDMYTIGMIENCKLAKLLYPDWTVWVYVNDTVTESVKTTIVNEGGQLISIDGNETTCWNMMWRFLPALSKSVDAFISRDADSRLTKREFNLVDKWMNSDKEMHIIRDHKEHGLAVCGGMFGLKKGKLTDMMALKLNNYRAMIESNKESYRYKQLLNANMKGVDQDFLESEIFKFSSGRVIAHVSAGRFDLGDIKIDPPIDDNFIGNVYYDAESIKKGYLYESGFTII